MQKSVLFFITVFNVKDVYGGGREQAFLRDIHFVEAFEKQEAAEKKSRVVSA